MLNNWAFAFNISVPVHIILRSFGSVTTMAAGWFRGKRYTRLQVFSVAALTMGVMVSAWADAQSKVCFAFAVVSYMLTLIGQTQGQLEH
jgi:dolichyl-phosphate-mannose-protein mannosyltransferase